MVETKSDPCSIHQTALANFDEAAEELGLEDEMRTLCMANSKSSGHGDVKQASARMTRISSRSGTSIIDGLSGPKQIVDL